MRQPRALKPLFLTEMWERFGFYTIQSLLIFFMIKELFFSDIKAFEVLGEFTAWVYISPLAGGLLADRILGFRYSILIGTIFLCLGYFLLAVYSKQLFFFSLASIIIGNGLLKPNISSYLGEFYYEDDPRRNAGFTFFYMAINMGGLLAALLAPSVQEHFGWAVAFALASLGMILAFISFTFGFQFYENRGLPIKKARISPAWASAFANPIMITLSILITLLAVQLILHSVRYGHFVLTGVGLGVLVYLTYCCSQYQQKTRNKLIALIILILASVLFWALLFQVFFSINLFTARNVDRTVLGYTIPAAQFISLEPIFIILLGPLLAKLWTQLHLKRKDPASSTKFALAMAALTLAMSVLYFAIPWHNIGSKISAFWLLLFYFLLTLGEMLLFPIGLSMVTKLAPQEITGFMMGVWFMALSFGGFLAGYLASFASIPSSTLHLAQTNIIYQQAFGKYALLAGGFSLFLFILNPWLRKMMTSKSL